jgi:membrane protease YdiL (CAAX protease family)
MSAYFRQSPMGSGSPFLAPAREGTRLTHPLLVVVVALGIWVLSMVARGSLAGDPDTTSALASAATLVPALIVAYGLRVLLVGLWVSRYEHRGLRSLGLQRDGAPGRFLVGFAVGLGLLALILAVLGLTGQLATTAGTPSLRGSAALAGVLVMLVGWLVQASGEEVLFRGFLLQSIGARTAVWVGVAVQALLFMVSHQSGLGSPIALVNLVLFAVFAALYALRQGSLWGVIGFHAGWNWALGNVAGLTVSGQDIPGGSLFGLRIDGPTAVSGGTFGVEGSLLVTAAFGLAAVAVWWSGRRGPARSVAG